MWSATAVLPAQVPLTCLVGIVAGIPQQLLNGYRIFGQVAFVARLALGFGIDRIVKAGQANLDIVIASK